MTNKNKLTSQQLFNRMIEGIVVEARYWLNNEISEVFNGLDRKDRLIQARKQLSQGLYKLCVEFFKKIKLPRLADESLLWFIVSFYPGPKFVLMHFLDQLNAALKNHSLYYRYTGEAKLVYQCYQPFTCYEVNLRPEHMQSSPSSHDLCELDRSSDPYADEDGFYVEDIRINVQLLNPLKKAMEQTLDTFETLKAFKALRGKYFVSHYQVKIEALREKITQYGEFFEQKRWDNAFESVIDFVIQASIARKGFLNFFPASFGCTRSVGIFFKSLDTCFHETGVPQDSVKEIIKLIKDRIDNAKKDNPTFSA